MRAMLAWNLGPSFDFTPTIHVFCGDAQPGTLQSYKNDGLPKYKDLPKEMHGSGETVEVV
jgi:hypothetical protein